MLHGIDLDVDEHNVVCLIGASGSGKSTLLRCINLLERIDAGTIVFDGQMITGTKVDVNALRQKIGIVFQAYNLFPHMTVLQNVMLAPRKALRRSRGKTPKTALGRSSRRSGSPTRRTSSQTGFRAGSNSASPSRARSRWSQSSCSSTRSPRRSIRS